MTDQSAVPSALAPPPDPPASRLLTGALLGIASGAILVPLNSTMLAVALPSVMDTFAVDAATVASLVTLYLATVAVALPASGSLGDRFGHRRVFLVGVTGFGIASLIAAAAGTFAVLAIARVLQATSGALVSTSAAALVREAAPPDRQGATFGVFDMLVSTSAAIGPFIGGLIVGAAGWRAMFVIAAPIALVAALAVGIVARPRPAVARDTGARSTPDRSERRGPRPIDVPGLTVLAGLLIAALLAIRGPLDGGIGTVAALAVVPLGALFIAIERRAEHPAIDPHLLVSMPFAAALVGVFGMTVVLHGCFLVLPLLVEGMRGGTALDSGVVLLGISALGAVAAPIGGRVSDRLGRRRPAVAGAIVMTIGLTAFAVIAPSATLPVLALGSAVIGFGMGLAGAPRQAAAMGSVPPDRVGMASGTYYTGRYLGGVVGASIAGAVLGTAVTEAGVSVTFAVLAGVGLLVIVASAGLSAGRRGSSR